MSQGIITSRAAISADMAFLQKAYDSGKTEVFLKELHKRLLRKKIRFPVLESAAREFYQHIPLKDQLKITDRIIEKHEIGGNVLAGIILQLRLEKHFIKTLQKAEEYIIAGDAWYVCDIIGERVMGHALLKFPEKTLPLLRKYTRHENKWMVRCIGVAGHYAVKKGLKKQDVQKLFALLLSLRSTTEFHTRKGIGWAVKTTARFHPDIIRRFNKEIQHADTRTWFRTKIKIGLGRAEKYASKYTG